MTKSKLLTISAFVALALGCSQNSTKEDKKNSDTLNIGVQNSGSLNDSIKLAQKFKASEGIAYDKFLFRQSEKEFNRLNRNYFREIGTEKYILSGSFNKNSELYLLEIKGLKESANYIDNKLQESLNNLVSIISKKYGEPTTSYGSIKFFDFQPGYIQWHSEWSIGNKAIKVGMAEVDSGSEYYVIGWIYDKKMYDELERINKNKSTKESNAEAEKF